MGNTQDSVLQTKWKNDFVEVVPPVLRTSELNIRQSYSFLTSYGNTKVIDDIIITNEATNSWLALLGTPLAVSMDNAEKRKLIQRVFSEPRSVLTSDLDGCFALVAYDGQSNALLAATDFNNTTPIYYGTNNNGLFLSSHELPLARLLQARINPLGFSLSIHLKNTWGSMTRFENVHRMLPCQCIQFRQNKKISDEIYWRPTDETPMRSGFDDIIEEWLAILKLSVRKYYEAGKNKNTICDFTGGEDSRLLLSTCHALNIPFQAQVTGLEDEVDVVVTRRAASCTGIPLIVRPKYFVSKEQLKTNASYINLMQDGCEEFFRSCTDYATDASNPVINHTHIKYCGVPGGEAFRGSYYLRGRALFPESTRGFDYKFFIRMKYLLDFHSGLLLVPDNECKNVVYEFAKEALQDVSDFPIGTKIDHLLRVFQTCFTGLVYKNPRYLPFSSNPMTRSIYWLPPRFKKGSRLTRACTEILFPELALMKTEKGVPTIRKTLLRTHLFMAEKVALAQFLFRGTVSRFFKITDSNKWYYKWALNAPVIQTLLTESPYAGWFSSASSMRTGHLYNGKALESLLSGARSYNSRYVPILGRIISQELSCRWVYRDL